MCLISLYWSSKLTCIYTDVVYGISMRSSMINSVPSAKQKQMRWGWDKGKAQLFSMASVFWLTWDRSGMSPRSIPTCCNTRGPSWRLDLHTLTSAWLLLGWRRLPLQLWGTQRFLSFLWGISCRYQVPLCTGLSSCQNISLSTAKHKKRQWSSSLLFRLPVSGSVCYQWQWQLTKSAQIHVVKWNDWGLPTNVLSAPVQNQVTFWPFNHIAQFKAVQR